jgi:Kef-type K+ transport system membrane component KefB
VFALFLGAAMSVTALPVLARILTERNLLNTRVGLTAISCAAVDDVACWCLLATILAASAIAWLPVLITYTGFMFYAVRPLLRRFQPWLPGALLILLASSWITEVIGVHALFGAFVACLAMPHDSEVGSGLESIMNPLLLPLFFALTGLRTTVALVSSPALWLYCAVIIVVAIVGKLFGCAIALRFRGSSWRSGECAGSDRISDPDIGLDRKIVSPVLFYMMVLMALVTTFMATPRLAVIQRCSSSEATE